MKVLQVNITGKTGSTGKIVNDIRNYLLGQGVDAIVAYSVDDIPDNGFYKISKRWELALALRMAKYGRAAYKGNPFAFGRLKTVIEAERPDLVHLHCINCNCVNVYKLLDYLSQKQLPTVVTHHAEFFYTGACPYAYDCVKFIDDQCVGCENKLYATSNNFFADAHKCWERMHIAFNRFNEDKLFFVAVSPWVEKRSLMSPIVNRYRCTTIYNGLDTTVFYHRTSQGELQKRILGEKESIVLHVSPYFNPLDKDNIKGGYYVVELAKRMPHCKFLVVATVAENTDNLPENVQLWGRATSQDELACLYSFARVTLLTSKKETFSMVTAESLCCGTPVVGFKAGGPESIAIKGYSCFTEFGSIVALQNALSDFLSVNFDKEQVSKESKIVYSKDKMGEGYLKIYQDLLKQ